MPMVTTFALAIKFRDMMKDRYGKERKSPLVVKECPAWIYSELVEPNMPLNWHLSRVLI